VSLYTYQAAILAFHDADTCTVDVDLGFKIHAQVTVRLDGLDAPELATDAGKAALRFVLDWLHANGSLVQLHTVKAAGGDKLEKYGRLLATILPPGGDGQSLNEALLASGNAKPYSGGKR